MFRTKSIFASSAARKLLCEHQLQSLDQIRHNCTVITQRKYGSVSATDLRTEHDQIRVYVKQQWCWNRWIPRPCDVWRGHAFCPGPLREWNGLSWLRGAGLLAAEPLALFYRRMPSPVSAIVIKHVPPKSSLFDLLTSGKLNRLEPDQQNALAGSVAAVLQKLHRAGYAWHGVHAKHLYPAPKENKAWDIWLIDCESVHSRITDRAARRDVRSLLRSFETVSGDDGFRRMVADKMGI